MNPFFQIPIRRKPLNEKMNSFFRFSRILSVLLLIALVIGSCTKRVVEPKLFLCRITDLHFEWYYDVGKPEFTNVSNGMVRADNKILKTNNGGKSWFACYDSTQMIYSLDRPNSDTSFISFYATSSTVGTKRTVDGGSSWTPAYTFGSFTAISMYSGKYGYAVASIPPSLTPDLLRTINAGTTWSVCPGSLPAANTIDLQFFDVNNGIAVAGSSQGIQQYRTSDGGVNWISIGFCNTYSKFSSSGTAFRTDNTHSIYKTTDFGNSWRKVFDNVGGNWISDIAFHESGLCVAGMHGVLLVSNDMGETWNVYSSNDITMDNYSFYNVQVLDRHTVISTGEESEGHDEFMVRITINE